MKPFPLLAEGDFPWVIAVMMFIAFVQWIMGKIRGTAEALPDAFEEISQEQAPPPRLQPPSTSPPPIPPTPTSGQEWRRRLETLKEAQSAPSSPPALPPRVPVSVPVSIPPVPAPAPPAVPVSAHPPFKRPQTRAISVRAMEPHARFSSSGLRITPQTIRDAVILKEILDPPVSLRD